MQQFVAFIAKLLELAARPCAGGFADNRHINLTTKACRCDGYRPDTLGGGIAAKAHLYPSLLPNPRPTCVREASPCLHSRKYFDLSKSRQSRNGSY